MPTIFISTTKRMEGSPRNGVIPMEKPSKIIRRSVYTFLQNYQYFTTIAAVFAFPFSVAILFSQAFTFPSSSPLIYNHLKTLFQASGFPPSSEFFNILALKLSQTISSSIFALPFAVTFLLLAKATIFQTLKDEKPSFSNSSPSFSSILSIFSPLFCTYLCNSFLIISANATVFSLMFFAFNILEDSGFSSPNSVLFLSACGAVLYSIVLANALILCNLAMAISGMEKSGGYLAILKACILIKGRNSTALYLALPINLILAGIEALFQYRILRVYLFGGKAMASIAMEGVLIAYLHSICLVLDTVIGCLFYKSCKIGSWIEQGSRDCHQIEIPDDDTGCYSSLKNSKELP